MSVNITIKREYEFIGVDLNGDPCIFPRDTRNHVFVQASEFKSQDIFKNGNYSAFPYATKTQSGAIVGIFSEGESHGASSQQVLFYSLDNGETFTIVENFFNSTTQTINVSVLLNLMTDSEVLTLKVWSFKKTDNVITYTTNSIIDGYAVWSRPVLFNNIYYRTGYKSGETALLTSTDGVNWSYKSSLFKIEGKQFNEADIAVTSTGLIAVCREDTGSNNNLYKVTSTDGINFTAPELIPIATISGRQPNLLALSDGGLLLATGDRVGTSGYTAGGQELPQLLKTTGVSVVSSADNGVTWGFKTRLTPMYSTDGGQPYMIDLGEGIILCISYVRTAMNFKPIIRSIVFNKIIT